MSAQEPLRSPAGDRDVVRPAALVLVAGAAVALGSVPLAALAGPPYLSSERVNGWIVVFAVGFFAAVFAIPFVIERLDRGRRPDSERRWERALLVWGAIALGVLGFAVLLGLAGDFSGSSLAGTIGLIAGIQAVLILGALVAWVAAS